MAGYEKNTPGLFGDWIIVSRIFIFHFALIFGFMLGMILGNASFGVILIFVLVKIALDLPMHINLHKAN